MKQFRVTITTAEGHETAFTVEADSMLEALRHLAGDPFDIGPTAKRVTVHEE